MTGHALITGCNRGIGLEFTRQYAADGWTVEATCRNPEAAPALKEVAARHPTSVRIHPLDVTDHEAIRALAAELDGVALDLLINNAGILLDHQSLNDMDYDKWRLNFETNTIAPFAMAQAFRPHLARANAPKLIVLSSVMGSIDSSGSGQYAYGSSKAAVNMVVRKLADDLGSSGILCATFHPGWVRTDMGGRSAAVTPEHSVKGMRKLIDRLDKRKSGRFFHYEGRELPW